MAPVGKPITAIDYDLCVNSAITSLKEEEQNLQSLTETTYISRSGRLTKRKVYTDEIDDSNQDSFSQSKKSRNEEWLSKSTIKDKAKTSIKSKEFPEKNSSSLSIAEKTNKSIVRSQSPDSQSEIMEPIPKDTFDELKENSASKPRTYQRKQPSNEEIMNRSSLFKDTPKRGRTVLLLNAAKEETEKKKLQEEQMEKFANSLEVDSQTLEDDTEKIIIDDEEQFVKRRVIPTLPISRRPIHGRKRGGGAGPEPLGISTKKANMNASMEEVNSSPTVNGASRRTVPTRRGSNNNAEARGEPSSSTVMRGKKEVNMTPCPLCSISFPQKEIEEHAATCGEDMFAHTPQPKLSRITCEVCDQVVPLTTEYEVHVKECIAKKS